MADQGYTVPMDPELARRKTDTATADKKDLDEKTETAIEEVTEIMQARERYGRDRKQKEREWTESFKMYVSWIDATLNPYLSNLFIPKTHEAVELLSAFLIGSNQSVSASPENGTSDTRKALAAGKWLDFLWRKVIKARLKILVWIKQLIVFGNGIIKVGWDAEEDKPWLTVRELEDVYFDYWVPDLQDSEYVFDEIRRPLEDVKADEKYDLTDSEGNLIREIAIEGGTEGPGFSTEALFNTYDGSLKRSDCTGKTLVLEAWCTRDNRLKTLLPTSTGWQVARDVENPNYYLLANGSKRFFVPMVKGRFKPSPVPNRAYDTGAVFPTVKIQKAFNDLINEYFDSVVLVNAPMWLKRRGARINPMELVRRPGGVITVSDINKDLRQETVGDVKQSIIEMLNRLDREFQEASMVVNLLKGIPGADTATESAIGQQNVQTLLDMIDENIVDALSEVGQMLLAISIINREELVDLKLYENDSEIGILKFNAKDIDGMHDIDIRPDRSTNVPVAIQNKQLLEFLGIVGKDQNITAKYPSMPEKIYKRYLENQGIGDVDYFFQEEGGAAGANAAAAPVQEKPAAPALPEGITQIKPTDLGAMPVPGAGAGGMARAGAVVQ